MANIDKAFAVDVLSINDTTLITTGTTDPTINTGYEAPLGSLYLRADVGTVYVKSGVANIDWAMLGSTPYPVSLIGNALSTGILDGGAISINIDPTKFNVSAGVGVIVDNHTDTLHPTAVIVSWAAQTAISVTNMLTADRSFIAINSSGAIVQSAYQFTNTEHKNYIVLGNIGHANRTNIVGLRNNPDASFDATARLSDLARALGPLNISGNIYTANSTNLTVKKSAGNTYRLGNNFQVTKADPDTTTDPAESPVSFIYSWRNGTGGWNLSTQTTNIDPTKWDNGSGTLQSVPNGKFTIQIIKYFSGISGITARVEYGQQLFASQQAGLSVFPDPTAVSNPDFAEGVTRSYLVLSGATSDLSNTSDAIFVDVSKFGGASGGQSSGSVTDLQQAYLNSSQPEITTDTTRGALSIKEGLAVGGNLFEGYNNAGTLNFSISSSGNLQITGTVDGRDVSVDGSTLDNLGVEVNSIETSLGTAVSTSGAWVGFTGTNNLNTSTSVTDALTIIDSKLPDNLLSRHNGAVTQTFSTTPTILLFDTNIRSDANYSYTAGVITINTSGTFEISFDVSYACTTNNITSCNTSLYVNGVTVAGTIAFSNHASSTSGQSTTTMTTTIPLVQTDTISIIGVKINGLGSLITLANGCRLNIRRIK